MQTKVYMNEKLYECVKAYIGEHKSYSSFVRRCVVAELERRGMLRKKDKKIISVTINDN